MDLFITSASEQPVAVSASKTEVSNTLVEWSHTLYAPSPFASSTIGESVIADASVGVIGSISIMDPVSSGISQSLDAEPCYSACIQPLVAETSTAPNDGSATSDKHSRKKQADLQYHRRRRQCEKDEEERRRKQAEQEAEEDRRQEKQLREKAGMKQ